MSETIPQQESAAVTRMKKKVTMIVVGTLLFLCLLIGAALFLIQNLPVSPAPSPLPAKQVDNGNATLPTLTPTAPLIAKAKSRELKFKNYTLTVRGVDAKNLDYSIWNQAPVTETVTDVDQLYSFFNDHSFFYVPAKDSFYELQSGGYISYSIVDESYINKNSGTSSATTSLPEQDPVKRENTCVKGLRKVGEQYYTALECKEQFYTGDNLIDESYKVACLINFSGNKYLMVNQEMKPLGTDADICGYLNDLGVTSITLKK